MNHLPKAIFISHGGGPLPLLGDPEHVELVACLEGIAADIPKPEAILLVSAHWEESVPTITAASRPPLIYDYYGFPPESYDIQYPCVGEPALAQEVYGALEGAGITARLDESRGFDHGLFVPLKIMYPAADIPCVQLSLMGSLDASDHIAMGNALARLTRKNLLVIGSGFSFHNLRAFFRPATEEQVRENEAFEGWLQNVCTATDISEDERCRLLVQWAEAPGARYCHPREEHLLPLHVCYGLVQSACSARHELRVMKKKCSMYLW